MHSCGPWRATKWPRPWLDVASRRAGAHSFKIFLTRCFSPCSDEINCYYRTRPRTGGLSQGQTARRRTQRNEAPFESDATKSTRGPISVSEKDNRLFRPTIQPSFSGGSNMRLVGLCALIFRVSFWLLRFFSLAALVPLWKKPFISSDHGSREPPRLPSHVMSVTFCFLCRYFAVSFQQACALFSKEHNPRAPRFQCGGRDRGAAASLRRLVLRRRQGAG